jgi:hypothetical protein
MASGTRGMRRSNTPLPYLSRGRSGARLLFFDMLARWVLADTGGRDLRLRGLSRRSADRFDWRGVRVIAGCRTLWPINMELAKLSAPRGCI